MDFVRAEQRDIEETGEYDLEGLFIRLDHAIDQIKAKLTKLSVNSCKWDGKARDLPSIGLVQK